MNDPANNPPLPTPSSASIPTISPQDQPSQTNLSDLAVSDAGVMTSVVPPQRAAAVGRYVLTAFHARGGMGEVWRCQDSNLGREVALKRLVSDRSAARERFLCEAQITGQLEHPSIVPVHDLGVDDNGQPFYVMKLVRGRTLKAEIEDYHAPNDASHPPRQVARVRLLNIFLDLCNAVAYAHSRGVIHRDLKPENVMLGAYGETVVLDWGLAKLSGETEPSAVPAMSGHSTSQPTVSSGNSAQTQDGSILGSPLYMPPEMAEGRLGEIDQRTDVYLLGATLYEILTGRPPRQGASRQEILEMARTAPPVAPRSIVTDTPRALEAICLKAMSRAREHRYEGALAIADEIQRFLAGEPVVAYPEPRLIRVWRWAKHHRRAIARTIAAAFFLALSGLAATLYVQAHTSKTREQANNQVEQVRKLADEARFYGASVDAPTDLMPYYKPSHAEELANEALSIAAPWGLKLDQLPLPQVREPLRQDLGNLCMLMARVNPQSSAWSEHAHELGTDSLPASSAEILFLQAESARMSSHIESLPILDDPIARQQRNKSLEHAIDGYQATIVADPSHYWAHLQLGRCYLALGRGPQAVEVLGACIAMRPNAPWGYAVRGLALSLMSKFDEAKSDLDRALELDPKCLAAHLNRGAMYRLEGMPEKAGAEFDALLTQPHPSPEAAMYRSRIDADQTEYDQALACLDRAHVNTSEFPMAAYLKAEIYLMRGNTNECLHELDSIVQTPAQRGHLLRVIASEIPHQQQKRALELALADIHRASESADAPATTFADLGAVLQKLKQPEQAITAYSRAIAASPDDVQTIINRGWCYELLNRLEEARADFSRALQIAPDQAEAMTGLGYIEARLGHTTEAQRQASLAVLHGGTEYLILHNVACIYAQLSISHPDQAKAHQDTAIDLLHRAIWQWRQGWRGHSEIELILEEPAFPSSMRSRQDFQKILDDADHISDNLRV